MNHIYKTIWNEQTGTFVAVSENKAAKGKRSSSCVKGGKRSSFSARMGLLALLTASALAVSNAWAVVEIPGDGQDNTINFSSPGGTIQFVGGGSIVGLSSLTISGVLSADQITVGGESVATLTQLNATSADVQTKIDGLETRVTGNESTLTDHGTRITDNETAITSHDTRITDNETAITAHDTRISDNETVIADHGSRIGTAEAGLVTINDRLTTLGVDDTNPGVKYFRANSEQPDAEANGEESIAIGPESKAEGDRSIAAGQGALADAQSAIALGDGASVASADSRPKPEAAIAIGKDSQSSGLASVAVGREAAASGNNALALGMQAQASGANGIALGLGAQADADNNISIGNGAGRATGNHLPGDRSHNIAIGQASGQNVKGQFNVALGDGTGNGVDGNENVALGRDAGQNIIGDSNVSLGKNANRGLSSNRAIGIGEDSGAETEGVAIGYKAIAGNTGVAVGRQTTALGTGTAIGPNAHADSNFVALGLNSYAAQNDVSGLGRFTNRGFDGSAVSVGSSQAGSEFTRRIVNVEDGANDTDAVNVRQLQSAVDQVTLGATVDYEKLAEKVGEDWGQQIADSKPRYFSVNDGGVDKGNKNNNGAAATAIDSIAIGPDATAKEKDSVAIGHMAGAEGASSVVMGHNIKGLGVNSTTIGNSQSEARDESGVAIGTHVVSRDKNSIVIGRDSYTDRQANGPSVENSIVIGTESSSTAVEGIVIGKNSVVNAARGIAQGSNAEATANDAMAFGTRSRAAAGDSQASGTDAKAFAARGIAMGTNARSGQSNPDVENQDRNRDSIALGTDSVAEFNSSIAVGREAQATADYAQAQGKGAHAFGEASIAQGRDAWALERQAIALGDGSRSTADRAVAIGQGARAGNARSIALGDGAETAGAVGTSNASLNGLNYGNFAGDRPVATVSVGTEQEKRTVTNVAAGRISASSTDAINGSQLYATNSVLGNVANTTKNILGGNATLAPNGTLSMSNIGDTGENTVHDAIKYAAQGWHVSANGAATENVKPGGSVDFSNDDGNITVTRTGTDLAFNLADDLTVGNSITVGDTVINGDSVTVGDTVVNGDSITTNNLTVQGETRLGDNFVVNNAGDVIYKGSEVATQNDGLSFAGNTGSTIAKTLGDNTPLTVSGELAEGEASTGANLRVDSDGNKLNLVMAQNLTDLNSITINNGGPVINGDGINMGGKKITDLAVGTEDTDAVNVSQLKEVSDVANAGWNISANGATAENVKPGGSVDFSNDDGNITVTRTGTDLAFNLADDLTVGNSITVGDTVINGDSVTVGDTVVNGDSITTNNLTVQGETRLGDNFVVNNAGDVIYKGSEVATQNDGLSFAGNTGSTIAKTLGDNTPLTISGELAESEASTGANLRVDSDGNQLNLVMAQNLTDLNSITINNGGPVINGDGINMGGKKITDLEAGTDDTDAVNVSQLKDVEEVANAGWNISANGGATENVKPGASVDFSNDDGNITVTRTGTDLAFNLADDLTVGNSITVGDTVINGDSVTTNNLTVQGETRLGDNFVVNNGGDVIYKGSEVATQNDGLSFAGNTGGTIAKTLGDNTPLTVSGELAEGEASTGANLRVDSDGNQLNLVMAQNLTDLNSITINNGGPVINGDGINMGGKKITDLEAGTDDTDAVNVSQLKDVEEVANAGWNISANGGATENVKPGASVDFSNDDGNITVTRTGTDLAFNLADDLTVGNSITVGDTVINGDSVTTNNLTVQGETRLGDNFVVNNGGDVIYKGSEVATQNDGLSFAGNTGGTIAKTLGDNTPLTISGELAESEASTGANLRVDSDGNQLNLVMAQNLTDLNSITINNGGPVINGDGINMGGKKITDLAVGTEDTDAVNVSQLKEVSDVANAGWNISANGAAAENVKPGASVDFSNDDGNITVTRTGTDLAFNLADDLTVGNSITVGGTVINGDSVTVGDTVVNGDSITTNNLTVQGETRLGDNFVVNNAGDVIYKGSEVATQNDGLSFAGNTGSTIAKTLGDNTPLTVSGELAEGEASTGANLRVDSDGNKLNLVMAQNLTDLNSITINNGGPVINGDGINMGGKKITDLAVGTEDTDAVNVSQLKEVSDVANAGWNISANGAAAENVKPGASVDFSNDDGNITVTRTGTDLAFNLADDLTVGNSITVGGTVINGDSVTVGDTVVNGDSITTNNLTVQGETRLGDNFVVNNGGDVIYKGNEIATQADGLSFAGNTGSTIAKTLGDNTPLTISGELAESEASTGANLRVDSDGNKLNLVMAQNLTDLNSITINNGGPVINGSGINMNGKKITNLEAGTDDSDAVNVSQLKDVEEVANAGWNISANGGATENVKPGASVDFSNADGNINITRDGTDLAFNLNKDIDLGTEGSLKTGNALVNNDGLTVEDGAGNKTSTTAAGTTVSNAAGDKTTVGAGSITVADAAGNSTAIGSTQVVVGGANPVTINGDTGRIGGLTNLTWDPDNYTSGQAATEDQLKQVNDVASAGWNVTDADGNSANIGPNGQVAFVGDKNVTVEQTGTDDSGQVEVKLNKDIDLGADGSLKTGDTVINNAGVAVGNDVHLGNTGLTINNGPSITLAGIHAGDMRITNVAAGRNPTDAVNYGQLQPIESFIGLDGNGSFAYNGGQHSSLKDVLDSMHWNVEAPTDGKEGGNTGGSNGNGSGSTGGGNNGSGDGTPIHNGNTVGFVEGDNIVISKTERVNDAGQTVGADIKVSVSQDLKVNSITAVNVQADEIQINNGGPIINENGINMSGKHITNVAAGVNDTDAVNVSQLNQVAGNLQGQINNIRHDINRLDNRLSAGVAAAMATASLPQAYLPGKHMMSMAGGTWRGESGMAIGFSGITDNGKWVYKLSGNTTSRGDYGGAVGIGYQW
ncbi:YadA-like family protein [Alcaligenes faecalis]|nr:YadA-like family protein [Alcaligenes faecalis]